MQSNALHPVQVDGPGQVGPSEQSGPNGSAGQPGFPMDSVKELHSFEIDPKRVLARLCSGRPAMPASVTITCLCSVRSHSCQAQACKPGCTCRRKRV